MSDSLSCMVYSYRTMPHPDNTKLRMRVGKYNVYMEFSFTGDMYDLFIKTSIFVAHADKYLDIYNRMLRDDCKVYKMRCYGGEDAYINFDFTNKGFECDCIQHYNIKPYYYDKIDLRCNLSNDIIYKLYTIFASLFPDQDVNLYVIV